MVFSLAIASTLLDPAQRALDLAEIALAKLPSFEMEFVAATRAGETSERRRYLVQVQRPQRARAVSYGPDGLPEVEVRVDEGITYTANHRAGQHTASETPSGASLRDVIQASASTVDPIVLTGLDADGWREYFQDTLRRAGDLKAAYRSGQWVVWTGQSPRAGRVELALRTPDLAPVKLSLMGANGAQVWTIALRPLPASAKFGEPSDTRRVARFNISEPPLKMDERSKPLISRMFAAYDKLDDLGVETTTESGDRILLAAAGRRIRQEDARAKWVYDGSTLVVRSQGATTRRALKAKDLPEALGRAGTRLDPLWGDLLTGVNPFRQLLAKTDIKWTGELVVQGQKAAIVDAHSFEHVYSLIIRAADGRVLSLATRPKQGGAALATRREFRYFPVNSLRGPWTL